MYPKVTHFKTERRYYLKNTPFSHLKPIAITYYHRTDIIPTYCAETKETIINVLTNVCCHEKKTFGLFALQYIRTRKQILTFFIVDRYGHDAS